MKKRNNVLNDLWEYIDMINPYATDEEHQAILVVYQKTEKFKESLDNNQKELFEDYFDSLQDFDDICLREAFIKGIKFATKYIMEVMDDNTLGYSKIPK